MSIDIGTVVRRTHLACDDSLTPEEVLSLHPSTRLWDDSPDYALAGGGLLSAESQPDSPSNAILALATDYPDRFRALVDLLPPVIADIFYQYYWLGRTYWQIGLTLFPGKSTGAPKNAAWSLVKDGRWLGERALAALASCDGDPARLGHDGPARVAWDAARSWRYAGTDRGGHPRLHPRPAVVVRLRAHRDLGAFEIAPNGQLGELFAPAWSVLGPSASGAAGC